MIEQEPRKIKRTSPSFNLLILVLIFAAAVVGYVAVIWSGELRGYEPSKIVAAAISRCLFQSARRFCG